MTDDILPRLHHRLVKELRRRGEPADRPVKVAALYEDLVPYRSVREPLGLDLNADYEHALLRLLAGEGGLLRLEPEKAREELRREAQAPYPAVGLFRKFAACDVWIHVPDAAEQEDPPGGAPPAEREAAGDHAPAHAQSRSDPVPTVPPRRACAFCGEALPDRARARFCPHCGGEQGLAPCPSCSAPLQPEWRYCIRCGQQAPGG